MNHLLYRENTWYFNRRVPLNVRAKVKRNYIRFSLKTDSKTLAAKLAAVENAKLENYWQTLLGNNQGSNHRYFKQVNDRSAMLGFPYQPVDDLAKAPLDDLLARFIHVVNQQYNGAHVEAVLGGVDQPKIKLSDALEKFWELSNDIILEKNARQIKKWENPRKLAMKNLINCIGDKAIQELTREDFLKFRDWWIKRILKENLTNAVARKNFIQTKTIISMVNDHYKLGVDVASLYKGLILEYDYEPRPPFSTEHIIDKLLNPVNFAKLNDAHQGMLQVFAETGICLDEQAGILPEDIFLDDPIPHVAIKPRAKDKLKTKYRKRLIPLVGYALEAFKRHPQGLSAYLNDPDKASSTLNKALRKHNLLPSKKHSVYSLRHSFQDRLTNLNCPDRIQTDLMGHKFGREVYGKGSTLETKLEWLHKIQLDPRSNIWA